MPVHGPRIVPLSLKKQNLLFAVFVPVRDNEKLVKAARSSELTEIDAVAEVLSPIKRL